MAKIYPIYISNDDKSYFATIPDFQNYTEGKTLEDVVYMAKDAICSLAIAKEDLGQPVPEPFSEKYTPEANETLAYVDVDFTAYRRTVNAKSVRKNVTIPEWLNDLAVQKGLNFSQLLQDKLRETLGIL